MTNLYTTKHKFWLGHRIHIDAEASIPATVTAIVIRSARVEYQVEWFAPGVLQNAWIAEDRLAMSEER